MKITVKQLADKFGVNAPIANGWLQIALASGNATAVGLVDKPVGQRGRAAKIYEIDAEYAHLTGLDEETEGKEGEEDK